MDSIGPYLFNDSLNIFFNETLLNITIFSNRNLTDIIPYPIDMGGATQPPQLGRSSDEVYSDIMTEQRISNIIEQINPDNLLDDIKHRLMGEMKDPVTGQWTSIVSKKAFTVSPILISKYIAFLGGILNQNTSLSNFSADEINRIMSFIIRWLADDLDVNADDYGLTDNYVERDRIGIIMLSTTLSVLKRAQNGMEARRIFSSLSMSEAMNQNTTQKKSALDAFKIWK